MAIKMWDGKFPNCYFNEQNFFLCNWDVAQRNLR